MIEISEIIRYASNLSPVLPIILLLTLKKKRNKLIYILTGVILVSFISDIIGFIMVNNRINNAAVSNTYYVIQFFLLLYFYSLQIKNKKLVYITAIIFIAFFLINTVFIQPFTTYQSWLRLAGDIIFICFSTGYYRLMMKTNNPPIDPFYHYSFWINSGVYYYFTFNLILFAMDNFVFTNMPLDLLKTFWGFHNFNNIVKNLLFGIAVIVFKNKNESPLIN